MVPEILAMEWQPKVSCVSGDLNEDNEITATDALDILRMVVGLR